MVLSTYTHKHRHKSHTKVKRSCTTIENHASDFKLLYFPFMQASHNKFSDLQYDHH